ncbi:MAG: LysM domain-containing protein [Chloroflexota bacterium]
MTQAASGAFGWLSNSFYVIIALAVVYLYFFKIVPLVAGKIDWSVLSIVRLTAVLILVAALLGVVAVNTADWIFANVLDTLPGTRMAREIDKVTGPVVDLTTRESNGIRIGVPWTADDTAITFGGNSTDDTTATDGDVSTSATENTEAASAEVVLKTNAMGIWAGKIQKQYNATGTISDNNSVMQRRDIPVGVTCDVYAIADGWQTKRYEDWLLRCSNDGFGSFTDIQLNGTAARGLTGGNFHSAENRLEVQGEGQWPSEAVERIVVPDIPDAESQGATQSGAAATGGPSASAAVSARSALNVDANGQRLHTVKQGDNLATIAETYGIKVHQLVSANTVRYPQLSTNPDVIGTGWRLVIP